MGISIHAPAQGATFKCSKAVGSIVFQSTLPHRERPCFFYISRAIIGFQSTLPHRERPEKPGRSPLAPQISIHAPAQGATQDDRGIRHKRRNFNPRSRTGSDRHATGFAKRCQYFNPRSRTGSDLSFGLDQPAGSYFNPRSRTGSDQWPPPYHADGRNFNPRSRTGSDVWAEKTENILIISIHAPAQGATAQARRGWEGEAISIHAPAQGATWKNRKSGQGEIISIHAPAQGATGTDRWPPARRCNFNPRSRTGSDVNCNYCNHGTKRFQSTLPHRERLLSLPKPPSMS